MVDYVELDYETKGRLPLSGPKSVGLYRYMEHPETAGLMVAYAINGGEIQHKDTPDRRLPRELVDALEDPHVEKRAFNAAFERRATIDLYGVDTPYEGWRCTMVNAYMLSFTGGLLDVGTQLGIDAELLKNPVGDRLVKQFSMPQKVTKNQPHEWRDETTDPEDWREFQRYNVQDVVAERAIRAKIAPYGIPADEWALYELDQQINDRGLPVNLDFCRNALVVAEQRKAQLIDAMRELTGLANPNSVQQLLPWLRERGYRFNDLAKDTLKKELSEHEDAEEKWLEPEAVAAMRLRRHASRTSPTKYSALLRLASSGDRLRHVLQFAGASRTNRWAGRGFNSQNLTRTPKELEVENGDDAKLRAVNAAIQAGDLDMLELLLKEPMDGIAGCVRSSFQAPENEELVVCDLSSIESAVIAWVCDCIRLLGVFHNKKDPYKDFGQELFKKAYEEVTKKERSDSKPAVLGAGYGLGGGGLDAEGKKTGLWGYAENMGIKLSKELSHKAVELFRSTYSEIPTMWKKLDAAVALVLDTGRKARVNGKLLIEKVRDFLTIKLPSGRKMYYYKPRMVDRVMKGRDGEEYTKRSFSYMGMIQGTRKWARIYSWGGKLVENIVQAIARDVLGVGLKRAAAEGFKIVGHVHDEIIALIRKGDNYFTLNLLRECMAAAIEGLEGLPLGAAGYVGPTYRKD